VRRRTTTAFAVLVASCAFAVTGCGGSDESTSTTGADEWATEFCTAVTTWTDSLQTTGDELKDPSSLNSDSLKSAADDVSSATDTFVEDVRGLGAPDTESGDEVKSALDTLSDTLESEKTDIEQAVDDISGLTGLASAVSAIGQSLSAMSSAFSAAFTAIDDADAGKELQTALEDSPACAKISNQ
jgi:hypothetical protein